MQQQVLSKELASACRVLFGDGCPVSSSFFEALHPGSLKSVFRRQALATHPDRAALLGKDARQLELSFQKVVAAYEVLSAHVEKKQKHLTAEKPSPSPSGRRPPSRKVSRPAAKKKPGPRPSSAADRFWNGSLPPRRLPIGQFLFFSGMIRSRQLLEALFWQRQQRPIFGQIAREWGILSPPDIVHILERKKPGEPFGACAQRLGYMTPFQRLAVVSRQKNLGRPLGRYFLKERLLRAEDLDVALRLQNVHNSRFTVVSA